MQQPAEYYLDRLRRHRPVPNGAVRRSIAIRWMATLGAGSLMPLGMYMGISGDSLFLPLAGWVVVVLSVAGSLAVASGWMARRRHGLDAQWGFAPLGPEEIREVNEIANADPELGDIVGLWAERCLEGGANMRGRDLILLRKMARGFLRARGATLPSQISPRV